MGPGTKKQKGDFAELKVACDLRRRGYLVLIPFGEEAPYDIVIDRDGRLERVQVKYSDRHGRAALEIQCYSQTIVKGRLTSRTHYTAEVIDWLAVYDVETDKCFYVPAEELGAGRSKISLRFEPARNGQRAGIRFAEAYANLEAHELKIVTD